MDPYLYACNKKEREAYMQNCIEIPSPYKIKIVDDATLRLELEKLLITMSQKQLALWALSCTQDELEWIDIGDPISRDRIIKLTTNALYERLEGRIRVYDLRKAGFLANRLAKDSQNEISKYIARSYVQAIAVGHMRGHAIVSSDYLIKVSNLKTKKNLEEARKVRRFQIKKAKEQLKK